MLIAFYTGFGVSTTMNIPEELRWEGQCRQLNITVCPQAPVCKWSTVKDRCEAVDRDGVFLAIAIIVCLAFICFLPGILRSLRDDSEGSLYRSESFIHASGFAWFGVGVVGFGFSIAFMDFLGILVSLIILALGVFAMHKSLQLMKLRMTYRLHGQDEEGAANETEDDEEDESRSSSSSSGPGLIDQAVDLVRVGIGMPKTPLPAYDVVVGDMPGAPSVDSPIYDHFTGN
jgi:hypothetical protein